MTRLGHFDTAQSCPCVFFMQLHFANHFAKQQWPPSRPFLFQYPDLAFFKPSCKQQWPTSRPFLFQYPGFPSNVPPVGHAPGTFVYINGAVCDDVTVLLWVLLQYESTDLEEGISRSVAFTLITPLHKNLTGKTSNTNLESCSP